LYILDYADSTQREMQDDGEERRGETEVERSLRKE
jgi:hypothetical protein